MKGIKNLFKVMNDPNKLCTYSGVIQLILNRLSNKLNTHWSNSETAIESILQKKLFSKIFAKFTRNHMCWSLFLIKLQG